MAEAKDIRRYSADPEARDIAKEEREHARTLKVMSGVSTHPVQEPGHRAGDGGIIRAAVLGGNDGLVSNFSLVMGVAGAVDNPDFVVIAGVAGLLAGAFSMASGEYVSMRSQREIYEHQIALEKAELEEWPEEEEEELAMIYEAKGLPRADAERVAAHLMANPELALDTMVREELGLNPDNLGAPWGAAISSFIAFAAGAVLPVLPYLVGAGSQAFVLSAVVSGAGLFIVGAVVALASGRGVMLGGLRMLLIGGVAASVTYGIGTLIGTQVFN
jgi:VIT1/CCC1 family predicted Fe2+/Mn2+ transporter